MVRKGSEAGLLTEFLHAGGGTRSPAMQKMMTFVNLKKGSLLLLLPHQLVEEVWNAKAR